MSNALRILHIIPALGRGGAERLVLNLAHQLQNAGHHVAIFTFSNLNEYPHLSEGITIKSIAAQVHYSLSNKTIADTRAFDAAIKQFNPAIIHTHLLEAELVVQYNPLPNVVYVSHWHGCPEQLREQPWWAFMKRDAWWKWNIKRQLKAAYQRSNSHFLCISDYMQAFVMNALHVAPSQCSIISNAVDTHLFRPQHVEKPPTPFRLVTMGKLNENKNQQFLIRVLAQLLEQQIAVELTILGAGPQQRQLEQLSADLNVAHAVHFRGSVSNPQDYINQADVLVHAAHFEAFGLVLIEAMACGKPVVCFNHGGPAEVVQHEHTGLLVEPYNLNAFCEAVSRLATDTHMHQQLSKQALAFSKQFSLVHYTQKVEALYQRLLARQPNA